MVPVAAGGDGGPVEGLEAEGEGLIGSTVVSPATFTVMVLLVSPAAKLTVPVGSTPPAKSAA